MKSRKLSTVATGAAIIFAGTLSSRLLGLVRDNMLGNTFTDRMVTDAYRSAFLVPDLLYYLLAGGALSAAFIPVFSSYLAKGDRANAEKTANSMANLMMLGILVGLILLFIFAPQMVHIIAPGYVPGTPKFNLTVILAREMCAMVFFTALSSLLTGMLQSVSHFLAPVVVWNTYSISIILGIGVFSKLPVPAWAPSFLHWADPSLGVVAATPTLGIHGAALGVVLGAITLAAVQLPVVFKHGFTYRRQIDLAHAGVRQVLLLLAPVTVGMALSQINLLAVPQIMGSKLPDGAVTDIFNANRLILLPMGLFAIAIATAAFPRLSQLAKLDEHAEFTGIVERSIKAITLLVVPSAVGLLLLAEPICALLYGGKGFSITDIHATAFTLAFFVWGLLGLSLIQIINRSFYALHDTLTPVIVNIGMVVASVLLSLAFIQMPTLQYGGIALASSITTTISAIILFVLLNRKMPGLHGRAIAITLAKIGLAAVIMGAVIYPVALLLSPTAVVGASHKFFIHISPVFPFRWPAPDLLLRIPGGVASVHGGRFLLLAAHLLLQIAVSFGAGLLAFIGALWLMKVDELHVLTDRFTRRFRRKPVAADA